MTTTQATAAIPTAAALERARALARAIGESAAFRAFEAAQEALEADADLGSRLSAFQVREQELRLARAWGGADPEEVRAMEREWEDLANHPVLAAHLAAREELLGSAAGGRRRDQRGRRPRLRSGLRSGRRLLLREREGAMAEACGERARRGDGAGAGSGGGAAGRPGHRALPGRGGAIPGRRGAGPDAGRAALEPRAAPAGASARSATTRGSSRRCVTRRPGSRGIRWSSSS